MGSLEYAQARLSARYGARPDEPAWRRLEHAREFGSLIDTARTSAFRHWITGIDAAAMPHRIEALLRERWRDLVFEVASWMPDEWQSAVRWCAVAADLPVVQHLARGGALLPWMHVDPVYRDLAPQPSEGGSAAPVRGSLAPLAAAWTDADRVARVWVGELRQRLPPRADASDSLLHGLGRELAAHRRTLRDSALGDSIAPRRALQARLRLLFRRAILDPAAAFVFLAQIGIDLERLRGELVRRAAFPGFPLAGAS
jgi:hypothetical protein